MGPCNPRHAGICFSVPLSKGLFLLNLSGCAIYNNNRQLTKRFKEHKFHITTLKGWKVCHSEPSAADKLRNHVMMFCAFPLQNNDNRHLHC